MYTHFASTKLCTYCIVEEIPYSVTVFAINGAVNNNGIPSDEIFFTNEGGRISISIFHWF